MERETAVVDRLDKTTGSGHCGGMQIEHDPHEPKIDRGPGPWKIVLPVMAAGSVLFVSTREVDWVSISLGVGIGVVLTAWAIEVTGNKVPDWWKSKPPGAGRS